jgi:hypothetical protein
MASANWLSVSATRTDRVARVACGRDFNAVTHFRDAHAADKTVRFIGLQPFFQPEGQVLFVRAGNEVRVNQEAHLKDR